MMGVLVVMFDGERKIGDKSWQDKMTPEAVKREKQQSEEEPHPRLGFTV